MSGCPNYRDSLFIFDWLNLSPSYSDMDTMHQELAALIKKLSKSMNKKQKVETRSDLEEKAIKLGKVLRGEVSSAEYKNPSIRESKILRTGLK